MDTAASVKPSLTIKKRFKAPPGRVYAAWTNPEELMKWMGPHQVTECVAKTDVRIGGRYQITMKTQGGEEHNVSGVYREIKPNEKLVFTWAWRTTPERESLVTITFKSDGDGTIMTFMHEQLFDEEVRDRHQHGWNGSFEKLDAYLS